MDSIIAFLAGKKTTIATIVGAVVVWALGRDYIAQDTAQLISVCMVALGFTANVMTARYYKSKIAGIRMAERALGRVDERMKELD
jgi:uncharacterized membrane protein